MKKKFDVNKFLTILSEPRKHKKLLNKEGKHPYGFEYPNEFGLDTDEFYYEIPDLITALEDAGYKDLIKINQTILYSSDSFKLFLEIYQNLKTYLTATTVAPNTGNDRLSIIIKGFEFKTLLSIAEFRIIFRN